MLIIKNLNVDIGDKKILRDMSFSVGENKVLGITGESGSGKSTLARILSGLDKPDDGIVTFDNKSIFDIRGKRSLLWRKDIAMVFQDAFSSLNSKWKVSKSIGEPIRNFLGLSKKEEDALIRELIISVGLKDEDLAKYPSQLSGGQQKRVAIEHAINKDEFVNSLLYGLEEKADSVLHRDLPFCDIDIKAYKYDIDRSKKLLEDAGWVLSQGKTIREKDGKPLKLSLIFPTDFIMNTDMAQAIKGYMREIGIEVELRGNEMMTWYADCLEGKFDMCIENTYGLPYDPYNLLSIMIEGSSFSISQQNLSVKPELDKNIETALFSNSDKEIQNAFKYVLKTVNEEAIYVPLSYQKDLVIFNNERVKDYTFGGLTEMIETNNIK